MLYIVRYNWCLSCTKYEKISIKNWLKIIIYKNINDS
jgi:hypothetical protein